MYKYIFTILLIFFPWYAISQGVSTATLSVSNNTPQPGETITLSLSNLPSQQAEELSWHINDRRQTDWQGLRSVVLQIENLDRLIIQVRSNNQVIAQTIISPIYIDIVAEPQTYVPSSYKGRSLAVPGSTVRLIALVEEQQKRNPNQYQYRWEVDGSVFGGGILNGENIINPKMPNRRSVTVKLTVLRPGIGAIGQSEISIPLTTPKMHFYNIHPLYGMQHQAYTDTYTFQTNNEITLQAFPFYMPLQTLFTNPIISWQINNQAVNQSANNPYIISLERNSQRGSGVVEFDLQDSNDFSQFINHRLRVNY